MTRAEKLIAKLVNLDGPFTWSDLVKLLSHLGYEKQEGKGSRVKFHNGNPTDMINLHKPHPGNELKQYAQADYRETERRGGCSDGQ